MISDLEKSCEYDRMNSCMPFTHTPERLTFYHVLLYCVCVRVCLSKIPAVHSAYYQKTHDLVQMSEADGTSQEENLRESLLFTQKTPGESWVGTSRFAWAKQRKWVWESAVVKEWDCGKVSTGETDHMLCYLSNFVLFIHIWQ